jgi:hypothetical protein
MVGTIKEERTGFEEQGPKTGDYAVVPDQRVETLRSFSLVQF